MGSHQPAAASNLLIQLLTSRVLKFVLVVADSVACKDGKGEEKQLFTNRKAQIAISRLLKLGLDDGRKEGKDEKGKERKK